MTTKQQLLAKLYPIGDTPCRADIKRFELKKVGGVYQRHDLRGKPTGEFRCPRKGEWYLSGAIPLAYLAPNDLSTPYYIARLVKVKVVQNEIVTME